MVATTQRSSRTPISVSTIRLGILLLTAFIFGLAVCSAFFLYHTHTNDPLLSTSHLPHYHGVVDSAAPMSPMSVKQLKKDDAIQQQQQQQQLSQIDTKSAAISSSSSSPSILDGLRILVTIASFDFMQLSHLDEVLDGFHDLCYAGSKVDIVVYTTVLVSIIYCAIGVCVCIMCIQYQCNAKLISLFTTTYSIQWH